MRFPKVGIGRAAAIAAVGGLVLLVGGQSAATASPSTALIVGSGSSWAANAVNQWVADVAQEGLQVVYTPDGDAQGRQDFATRTSAFAVTSIGYQGFDPVTGVDDTSQGRPYAYLPIAAGGTSFPYHIFIDGQQLRTLRLSGETIAKIFTNQITNWDNPAITADNNGHALPSLPIIPVVQSEGSGATAQLTQYFATEFPSIWQPYSGLTTMTEYYPRQGPQMIAQNGSDGAMNYISSNFANGSIGYVEYSYPLAENYPVADMLNSAGYYTLPTQYNVAVALEKAQINMDKSSPDYLLQTLTNVYTDPDPRTYPLSSYVYMIEPTGTYPTPETQVTPAMRQTIADFAYYAICQGQREIGPIGYSPLPVNLVEAAFGQIEKLQQASPGLDLAGLNIETCDNPTFVEGSPNTNYLATIAPLPPACDKIGAGPCAAGVIPNGTGPEPTSSGSTTTSPAKSTGGTSPQGGTTGSSTPGTQPPGSSGKTTTRSRGKSSGSKVTSSTGVTSSGSGGSYSDPGSGAGTGTGLGSPQIVSAVLAGYSDSDLSARMAPLAVVILLLILMLPAFIGHRRSRKRRAAADR
jgi:phosphate transport system substrate-binding protein